MLHFCKFGLVILALVAIGFCITQIARMPVLPCSICAGVLGCFIVPLIGSFFFGIVGEPDGGKDDH